MTKEEVKTRSLDTFFEPEVVKPKQQDTGIDVQENCSDCGEPLGVNNHKYTLRIKGEIKPYCRGCAKKRLPKPDKETSEAGGEENE